MRNPASGLLQIGPKSEKNNVKIHPHDVIANFFDVLFSLVKLSY